MWMKRMRDCMLIPLTINHKEVLIDVDFKVGRNWGPYNDDEEKGDLNPNGLKGIEYDYGESGQ